MVFRVFGSRKGQESNKRPKRLPKDTQETPKRHAKTCQKKSKKCLRGKKCLKLEITFWAIFGTNFRTQICTCFKHVLHILFLPLFRNMLKLILEPILGSEWPKRAKMSPKEPSGASKNQNLHFQKP